MERKASKNLEYTAQKLCGNQEDGVEKAEKQSSLLRMCHPMSASGGDMGAPCKASASSSGARRCDSKNASYHHSTTESDESADEEVMLSAKEMHSDSSRQHFSETSSKKRSKLSKNAKLKNELSKYHEELKEYTNTTKNLEEKYLKINFELNEMQQKHERFVSNRKNFSNDTETYSDSCSSSTLASEYSLKRKYTQVFHRGSSFMTMLPLPSNSSSENMHDDPFNLKQTRRQQQTRKKRVSRTSTQIPIRKTPLSSQHNTSRRKFASVHNHDKENEPPPFKLNACSVHGPKGTNNDLKDIYKVLKNVLEINEKNGMAKMSHQDHQHQQQQPDQKSADDLKKLQSTVSTLQNEQEQFKSIIQQQQACLNDYHSRCMKAQHIMHTQQQEIEKLNINNQQLESEINTGMDKLRMKIDTKLKDVAHLPQLMREEQYKYEKAVKENCMLSERMRQMQHDAAQTKMKADEINRRKSVTLNRLKVAERDLKIFKNYNTALKHEKRKLGEELQKMRDQLEAVQQTGKRSLARQRDVNEKQRRELQKRVFELELKLSRSQNSTTALIQERDSLIAELQTQLNTLVHNFEVSQKHIRVLRRHIYSMSGGNVRPNGSFLNEAT